MRASPAQLSTSNTTSTCSRPSLARPMLHRKNTTIVSISSRLTYARSEFTVSLSPNAFLMSLLLASCHAGLIEEDLRLFYDMKREFGVKLQMLHYGCIVDLLGRAGQLQEAYDFIMRIPASLDDT